MEKLSESPAFQVVLLWEVNWAIQNMCQIILPQNVCLQYCQRVWSDTRFKKTSLKQPCKLLIAAQLRGDERLGFLAGRLESLRDLLRVLRGVSAGPREERLLDGRAHQSAVDVAALGEPLLRVVNKVEFDAAGGVDEVVGKIIYLLISSRTILKWVLKNNG